MLEVGVIRANKDKVIAGLAKRGFKEASSAIEEVLRLDAQRKSLQQEKDRVLAEIKSFSAQIQQSMSKALHEKTENLKKESKDLKITATQLSSTLTEVHETLRDMLYNIPNVPHNRVPLGQRSDDNITVYEYGTPPVLTKDALPHWDLVKKHDIINFEEGTKITGSGFPVYKREGARLQRALINFFLDSALKEGYCEIQPPILINEASGYGTGQLPDKEGQMYHVGVDGLYLVPTAEVPITNLYRGNILAATDLPIKDVGYTPCFRKEAGSWGAHVRGLNRLHQFDKVEIIQIRCPEDSYQALEEMSQYVQNLLEQLELPYRKALLCSGDIGFNAALTYDMEVYAAAQHRWLEVSSVSNFETYQANRLQLKVKDKEGNKKLAHTLNGSALALPRVLAALLENNQFDGGNRIRIPKVLVPYTGFDCIGI